MQLGKRLGHKKSRNGCLRCKARRVKLLPTLLRRRSTQLQERHRNIMSKVTRARANVLHETGCRVFNSFITIPPQSGEHS
ncbi:hypothetical protein NCS57_00002900 [Fusarium keratoplasticum]|uniref:Uncharacterized protein n=1 Tax=Fusarium keratoplasticum TaxID=1328300 RepID=A0ACC0REH4_9HYPO|nr:hypothetical protein NCS57_00002900 [Fusarium keratoplasticum]KAI8683388.1 hypothetical protein NCS57_00002900 [Fusarium keratoplasticum]